MRVRHVERLEHWVAHVALYEHIDTAARALLWVSAFLPVTSRGHSLGQVRHHARAAHLRVQLAADRQDGIANRLAFQPVPRETPEQLIVGIDSSGRSIVGCRLTVGVGSHYKAVDSL